MKIVVYVYSDPLYESPPDSAAWGWEVDRIYRDLGKRQQLLQLIEDCRQGDIGYVLLRRLEELGETVEQVCDRLDRFRELGVQVVATDTPSGEASPAERANILGLFQNIQKAQRSQRIRQGHARNRVKALPPPGKAPYGYRRGKDRYTIDRAAAPVIKEFFDHFLIYGSLHGAVRHLAQRYGKRISVTTGRRWLTNPVYRGDLTYRNGTTVSDTHVPILSREEAAQIDRLLRRNRRLPPRTASAPRSLAGLVVCGECGSSMSIACVTRYRKPGEYLYLRPTDCPNVPKCKSFHYELVLQRTIEAVCRDLSRVADGLPLPDMDGVKNRCQREIVKRQQVLDVLPQLLEEGILDEETLQLRSYTLNSEISELQAQLAQLPPVNLRETAKVISIPQFWLDLTESERRFYFREFVRQIEIHRDGDSWDVRVQFMF
ncbi:MAG: recombinase family protein [Cyanobacteria bacterium SID2]|nr:recombinase family protein [Cyanobacteria bacterium SID2]MBP0005953.1 recombinase family protein [Cyanobacteria bacterium SBC]